MKHVKMIGIVILAAAFITLIIALKWRVSNHVVEKEETRNSCDYFNGEVTEVSEEYVTLKPMAEWTWDETSRAIIPIMQVRGDHDPVEITTQLSKGNISELKPGDKVRVAFNAQTMEWSEDEVHIGVIFMIYRWEDDAVAEGMAGQQETTTDKTKIMTWSYYEDCDEEIRKELEEKLEAFFEDKSFEGFDQGHTDVIWYWAALSLYKQENAMEEDGLLSVSMEAAQKWMEEQFEMPKGSEKRLAEGMPKEDAKHPVSAVDEKLWFYPCVTKKNSSFHIQVAQKHDDTYFVGGEVTTDDGETIKTGLFTAEFMKGENGAYKFTRVNAEDFHTSSLVTKSVPGSNEFEKQIKDAWQKVAEAKNAGSTISLVELEKVEEALKEAFGTPMLGSFNQENMFAAVQFYAQKKLHADLTGLSYHESADYYTATIDEFASWMGEMFVVPDAYEEQVKQIQNDQTIRISGDKLVFRFYQPSMSEHFCVDGGREVDGELFIYGHNPDITQAPDYNEQLLGTWYPFYEFAAILVKNEEGRYLIKEFYIK